MALVPLLIAIVQAVRRDRAANRRPFLLGLTTGAIYFAGTLYWLPDVMVTFGGLAYPLALFAALLLVAYLGLFPALFAFVTARAWRWIGPRALLLSPLVWAGTEMLRGRLFTGFPWVPLGNSQIDVTPVVQTASLIGVYGLSALVALVSAAVAYGVVVRGRARFVPVVAVAVLVAGLSLWGARRVADGALLRAGEPVTVGLVQGNIPQGEKWNPANAARIFNRYLDLSREAADRGARLVIWPESSTPFMFEQDPVGAAAIKRLATETGTTMLLGSDQVEHASPPRYYNSAFLIEPGGRVGGVYRKMQLVPFGEYVPLRGLLFFVGPLVEAVGEFAAGDTLTIFTLPHGTLSTAICYEAVFPHLAREAVARGSRLLSTITNDAWYGRSSAPWQHFDQARMRTVETGRYLVRAANTGISGIVDPYGRVVASSALFEEAVVVGDARFLEGTTLYARIGEAVAWTGLAVTGLLWAGSVLAARRYPSR